MFNQLISSNLHNVSAYVSTADFLVEKKARQLCSQHYHDEIEFLDIYSGEFCCIINDEEYIGYPGDIFFINSRVPHYTKYNKDNTNYSMLQYSPYNVSEAIPGVSRYLSRFINISKKPIVCFKSGEPETEELKGYLENIFKEYNEKKSSYELYIKAGILSITAFLSRQDLLSDPSLYFNEKNISKILPALNYIDKNFQKQITLEEISKVANLDPYYFCRLFKKSTNSTFVEYLNFVRVAKSEKMLSETDETISEIAYYLGFSSVSYFNRIFKKYKNCTPTQYKKSKYLNQ